jgi:tetratricopeptide (TPR) repeat protein
VPVGPNGARADALSFDTAHEALAWTKQERTNLVAATRQAADTSRYDLAWKIAVAAAPAFEWHGYRAEWSAIQSVALTSARNAGDRYGEAWVLNDIGIVLTHQQADGAVTSLEEALAIRTEIGDRTGQAQTANNLAFSYSLLGLHEQAVATGKEAVELQRLTGRRHGEGLALTNLGLAYLDLGDHDAAIKSLEAALDVVQEVGSSRTEGYVRQYLGRGNLDVGQVEEAADLLEQALAIHTAYEDTTGQAQDLQLLGVARLQADQPEGARQAWQQALTLFEELDDKRQAAITETHLASLEPPDADA